MSDDEDDIVVLQTCTFLDCGSAQDIELDPTTGTPICASCLRLLQRVEEEKQFRIVLHRDHKNFVYEIFKKFSKMMGDKGRRRERENGNGDGQDAVAETAMRKEVLAASHQNHLASPTAWTIEDYNAYCDALQTSRYPPTPVSSQKEWYDVILEECDLRLRQRKRKIEKKEKGKDQEEEEEEEIEGEYEMTLSDLEERYGFYLYNGENAVKEDIGVLEDAGAVSLAHLE